MESFSTTTKTECGNNFEEMSQHIDKASKCFDQLMKDTLHYLSPNPARRLEASLHAKFARLSTKPRQNELESLG